MSFIYFLDLFGTFVFAISGILTAIEKKFDVVGTIIIGIVTAIGGGTLRDMLIGSTPVGWMLDEKYLLVILLAMVCTYYLREFIVKWRKSLFLFDTIGIGLFTILGLKKTLELGLSPVIAIMMGIVSAVFGGVIRDVLTNEIPLIFRKEIYATACLVGAIVFLLLQRFSELEYLNMMFSIMIVIVIRTFSVMKNWSLPFQPK